MADLSITAGSVIGASAGQRTKDAIAGETITAGQLVYEDASDSNKIKLADADDTAVKATVIGIALNGASDGQPIRYQTHGNVNPGATVVVGEIYVVSGTPGGIAPEGDLASSDYVSVFGIGTTTSNIVINIQNSGAQVP